MKKLMKLILVGMMIMLVFAACGNKDTDGDNAGAGDDSTQGAKHESMTMEEIMAALLDNVSYEMMTGEMTADDDSFQYYFFIDPIENSENIISESLIGSVAHSICVLRVPDDADAAAIAADIEANMNPSKWICVTAEKAEVLRDGNLIVMIMSFEDIATAIEANFENLK